MNLKNLLRELGISCDVRDAEVTDVTENVRNVKKGSLFVAVEGRSYDGNMFIRQAFESGAVAVISDRESDIPGVIKVSDSRTALSFLCSAFYGHPQDKMKIIGITGTNGKTTTCEYLRHILEKNGRKCGIIGTLGCRMGEYCEDTGYTTPCAEVFFRELKTLSEAGCEYCIVEVSSQALDQKRVEPVTFTLSVFTNIGNDHIDYHGSVEKYANIKAELFRLSEKVLINTDDAYSYLFEKKAKGRAYLYSAKNHFADYMAKDIRYIGEGLSFIFLSSDSVQRFQTNCIAPFSVYNILAATAAADILGVSVKDAAKALSDLPVVKGRMEKISSNGIDVFIDFAHTPEALRAVLEALKLRQVKGQLICVFGCGGNRDKGKRSEMGGIAGALSDTLIVTTDNPRNEEPGKIVSDIIKGVDNKCNVFIQLDREQAIKLALNKASPGDTVLIAGKGHENYQLIGCEKKYFNDEHTVRNLLGVM